MSKFACVGLTEVLRHELAVWGIQAISIEPGGFKTQLVDPDNVSKRIDESFERIDEDTRNDYGDNYFMKFKERAPHLFCLFFYSPKISLVIDDVETAISVKYPDTVYVPCASIFIRIIFNGALILPTVFQIYIVRIFFVINGFPKPKKAN
ncbi:hypothetical protein NPIL_563021 [Nephila pilipes]|uniref:Uncharacterized protein n=1 Tax=Nephila pilipes TaxID=299642 RepID=A0A8X6QBT6_NEPPI|nr:hypothetical protein NPIL_563021 [Nephila pilipes]